MCIIGQQQLRFGDRVTIERIELGKTDLDRLLKLGQAAYALGEQVCFHCNLDQKALSGTRDMCFTLQPQQIEVCIQVYFCYIEKEVPALANRQVYDEANIQPEWITRVCHGVSTIN